MRTFGDWNDPCPGFFEGDLVAHCGGSMAGSFVHTFTLTDIASGWTEGLPLLVREQGLVTEALDAFRERLPVALRGLDTDNDSVFMNGTLVDYCDRHGIELSRSRAYRKNDQACEAGGVADLCELQGLGRHFATPSVLAGLERGF